VLIWEGLGRRGTPRQPSPKTGALPGGARPDPPIVQQLTARAAGSLKALRTNRRTNRPPWASTAA